MEITISGKDKKLLEQVEALAKRLGLDVINPLKKGKIKKKNNSVKLYQLMEKAAADGGLFQSIKYPVIWQKYGHGDSSQKTTLNSAKTKS